jgi:hypothetical protein
MLQDLNLNQELDDRRMIDGTKFSTRAAYLALQDGTDDESTAAIWESRVPRRIKTFGWLLHLNRLNIRANQHRKNIIDTPHCPTCPLIVEDCQHLFIDCPAA